MGAWGIMALESDEGLDIVDFLGERIPPDKAFSLGEIIRWLREEDFLGEAVDFFYDNSAMALSELYLEFADNGFLHYEQEDKAKSLRTVATFTADAESLRSLLDQLCDIRDEVPDDDGEREIIELWRDSDSWEEWSAHLRRLIERLQGLLEE